MAKKNRECHTCGEKYSYCPNCNRNEPSWMAEFHDENCKNIFQICTQYNVGLLTKEQAKESLNACDLSNKENFTECIQRDFENIFAEDKLTILVDAEIKEMKNDEVVVEVYPSNRKAKHKSHEVVKENE